MAFTPFNFVFSLHLEPIYEWQADEENAETAAAEATQIETPPPADPLAAECLTQNDDPQDPQSPAGRFVLKGYEWRPNADCITFPRPGWEGNFGSRIDDLVDSGDSVGDELRRRSEEAARDRKALLATPPAPARSAAPSEPPAEPDADDR